MVSALPTPAGPAPNRTAPGRDTSDRPANAYGAIEGIVQSALSPGCYAGVADHLVGSAKLKEGVADAKDLDPLAAAVAAAWRQKFSDPFGVMTDGEYEAPRSWLAIFEQYGPTKGRAGGRTVRAVEVLSPGGFKSGPTLGSPLFQFEEEGGRWKLAATEDAAALHRGLKSALETLQDYSKWPAERYAAYKYVTRTILQSIPGTYVPVGDFTPVPSEPVPATAPATAPATSPTR